NISDKSLFEIARNCHDLQEFYFAEYLDFSDAMALWNDRLIIAIIKRSLNLRYMKISGNDIGDK
ncbi:14096_t:CDS:2, partial [Funneliformis geosporum]